MIKILTKNPIATDSPDHIYPLGTSKDNSTNAKLIPELESRFGRKFTLLDLGCAGGRLIKDINDSGNFGVGLEGSDYSKKIKRPHWNTLDGTHLFTCDITKPFTVLQNNRLLTFDVISMWDVIEHIKLTDMPQLMGNVKYHLSNGGIFIGTIFCGDDGSGVNHHQTIMQQDDWKKLLVDFGFMEIPAIENYVRWSHVYFTVQLARPKIQITYL